VPGIVPAWALTAIPLLPLDRGLAVPLVHADDVADAIERVIVRRAPGPFNLAAEPPVTTAAIASALGARNVHVPSGVVRAVVSATWHARLQQVDPGWVDMGYALPLLDCSRATRELGWSPTTDATAVLHETLSGMRDADADRSPVLRPRTVVGQLRAALRGGPVSHRRQP
jgi:nucleoside-diphosphate-sugar epimerase